jgi:hypothetical protein
MNIKIFTGYGINLQNEIQKFLDHTHIKIMRTMQSQSEGIITISIFYMER